MTLTDAQLAALKAATADANRAVGRRDQLARKARDRGATWTELGYALGITAQGAQRRYGTSPERVEAHRERAAKRAVKRLQQRNQGD